MEKSTAAVQAAAASCLALLAACSLPAGGGSDSPPAPLEQAVYAVYSSTRAARHVLEQEHGHLTVVWPDGATRRFNTAGIEHPDIALGPGRIYFQDRKADYIYDGKLTRLHRQGIPEKQVLAGTFTGPPGYEYVAFFNGPGEEDSYAFTVSALRTGESEPQQTVLKTTLASLARCESGIYATSYDLGFNPPGETQEQVRIDFNPQATLVKLGAHQGTLDEPLLAVPVPCHKETIQFPISTGTDTITPEQRARGITTPGSRLRSWDARTGKITDVPITGFDDEKYGQGALYYDMYAGDGHFDILMLDGRYWRIDSRTGRARVLFTIPFHHPTSAAKAFRLDGDTVTVVDGSGDDGVEPVISTYAVPSGKQLYSQPFPSLTGDQNNSEVELAVTALPGLARVLPGAATAQPSAS